MAQKILVVDDTPANVKLLGDLLRHKGYEVSTATNGEEAPFPDEKSFAELGPLF